MEDLLHAGIHWSILNFLIFVGLLFYFLKKPVAAFWVSRSEDLKVRLGESERLAQEAKRQHQEWSQKAAFADEDARNLVLSFQREGDHEKSKLMEEALYQVNQIKSDGTKIAKQEMQKARETLKVQTAKLAVESAAALIKESMKPEDQTRLTEGYLKGVEHEARGSLS
jgi:F-type H+-transporting ATPase subunit b